MFSGQGAQQVGMGSRLYAAFESARRRFDQAEALVGWPLRAIAFEGPEEVLTQTLHCQVALYVQGYIVFELLRERGHLDGLVGAMGLSLGELTALAVAGVFDFETGLKLVAQRAGLMESACQATPGTMASLIGGNDAAIEALCKEFGVSLSNKNCPGQRVLSGPLDAMQKAIQAAQLSGTFRRVLPLKVAGAYHSPLMASAKSAFEAVLAPIEFKAPGFTVWSNVTGGALSDPAAIKAALPQQIVCTVLFEDNLLAASQQGVTHFYECGPSAVLSGLVRRTLPEAHVTTFCEPTDFS